MELHDEIRQARKRLGIDYWYDLAKFLPPARNGYGMVLANKLSGCTSPNRISLKVVDHLLAALELSVEPLGNSVGIFEAIKARQKEFQWSTAELAGIANVPERTLYRFLKNGRAINLSALDRLLTALDIQVVVKSTV